MNSSTSYDGLGGFPVGGASPVEEMSRHIWHVTQLVKVDARAAWGRMRSIDTVRIEWERTFADEITGRLSEVNQRALRAEIAAAMRLSERAAEALIEHARILIHDLPEVFAGLGAGLFSERVACVIADVSAGLPDELLPEFTARVLPLAETLDPSTLRRRARREREKLTAATLRERHEKAIAERCVRFEPAGDGMAYLTMFLTAEHATAIHDRVDRIARHLGTEEETRTHDQLRADVLTDLLLDDGAELPPLEAGSAPRSPATPHRGIRPSVHVTVPALTLLDRSDEPAILDGYGPIDIETAKRLAGAATGFTRILTHPETGIALSFGRERYQVPAELRAYLRARDETCRFVGCTRSAALCDLDHTQAWAHDGRSDHDNLAHLCRSHHRIKHASRWSVTQPLDSGGTLRWVSPLGRTYETKPAQRFNPNSPKRGPGGLNTRAQTDWATDPPPF